MILIIMMILMMLIIIISGFSADFHRDLFIYYTEMNEEIPHEVLCPITLSLMEHPVTNVHGHTFDRDAIMSWYVAGSRRNPLNNMNLPTLDLTPNRQLKTRIDAYRQRVKEEGDRQKESWTAMLELANYQIEEHVG